ncbi:MAG: TlpA family protein disulfide reductase [Holosporales bacterium]
MSNDLIRLAGGILLGLLLLAGLGASLRYTHPRDTMFKEPVVWDTSTLRLVNNQRAVTDFSKLKGNWLVVYFWSTSCAQCEAELPSYNRMARGVTKNSKIKFLIVSTDAQADAAFKYVAEKNYQGVDSYVLAGGVAGIKPPLVLLINPAGQVIGGHREPVNWRDEKVLEVFEWHAKNSK